MEPLYVVNEKVDMMSKVRTPSNRLGNNGTHSLHRVLDIWHQLVSLMWLGKAWSLKSAANDLCCFASLSNPAIMVPTAMVGGSNSSSAVGSRNKSGSGPSSSEALFGVVASDDGSVWVKSGSGVITCGLEAGKLGISSQSSILSTLVGFAVRF